MPQHSQFVQVDPFHSPVGTFRSLVNALLATAVFRCWYLILFFSGWAAAVCLISQKVHHLGIQSTMLTVLGTVLGFVISYRTSSSFERYNEGRRLWSSVILGSRTLARFIWFHVPDTWSPLPGEQFGTEEMQARSLIEKKTAINLIEAFAVSLKAQYFPHYLRGEEGVNYEDLYHLVKYLPVYALPRGMPPTPGLEDESAPPRDLESGHGARDHSSDKEDPSSGVGTLAHRRGQTPPILTRGDSTQESGLRPNGPQFSEPVLLPPILPPKFSLFDVFPFSLIGKYLAKKGRIVSGKKHARTRAKTRVVSHNIPLEIAIYLSSYIATLQQRKTADVPTVNGLLGSLAILTDALTGLERVLTTPIPFSYSIHLWSVTIIYVFFLPFQLWSTLRYVTIPATAIAAFFFFGFLAAGEEIENPFGYDKVKNNDISGRIMVVMLSIQNDLNMDHFCHNIIRLELRSITSRPMPKINDWMFSHANDRLFDTQYPGLSPDDWVKRGKDEIMKVLVKEETYPRTPVSAVGRR
ncbi:Bestrophin, RFP-TM, chloride channel-domain-containing protein [Cantharellus anzutake]|uniref:Bestrophin, RFP-TM, chloride channel-domain-containing protein n=1 Tax=Cantharellus anzutake TaxID=1750568 RepID=UPI001903ED01|nr:Bestrophin, RFP-TM, chloride channel-domain-containing protein [Cantharellus anzutake]KAF8342989.1 Bestrophin, RFP-TM, chloride channel-domain-containing protein [Cantharellus anzutake]